MIRLDKFLSEASRYTRSEAKKRVRCGAVTVNGTVIRDPDAKVDEMHDLIKVNKEVIFYRKFIYLMLNKPQGYLSATEDLHDPVVIDLVPEALKHFGVFPVGRLDKDTEGLLLLTNDGQFDHALMSPRREVRKRYFAQLDQPAVPEDIEAFRAGMKFQEFTAAPAQLEIDPENPAQVFIEIREGKFHQVKRMCERVGKTVIFLKRIAIGNLVLDETLKPGELRELTQAEIDGLLNGNRE